ncbi:MAG: DUF1572 family protein [Bacteroidota bacterium]
MLHFTEDALKRMLYYKSLGDRTFEQLEENNFHWRPDETTNSIAIIIQHMYGNMMNRFTNLLTEDGEKDWRKRDEEFEPMELTKQDLLDCWNTGWHTVSTAIELLQPDDLEKEVTIRSEKLTVYDAILRQLAHYAYHIGQIVFIGKMLKNESWKNLSMPKRQKGS